MARLIDADKLLKYGSFPILLVKLYQPSVEEE